MAEVLKVNRREKRGGGNNRRLRLDGQVPAILYGHGEESVSLSLSANDVMGVIRHGGKLVKLEGAVTEGAFIKAVQWDVYGKDLIHIDLLRVSETEKVRTTVRVELKGTAVGLSEGGVIEHIVHELEIECPAAVVPEKLVINLTDLHLNDAIHARQVPLPEGARVIGDPEMLIVHCIKPHIVAEEPTAAAVPEAGAVEPELIRKEKPVEEEAEEEK
jgi:large subunit ribosomal protein L25